MSEVCSRLGIPEHLHSKGKGKDLNFSEDESLYRRFFTSCPPEEWKNNTQVSASVFRLKDDSYVWSKHTTSHLDVLYNDIEEENGRHYCGAGVLDIKILPISKFSFTVNNEPRTFTLKASHEPQLCNYPHAELHVYENGLKFKAEDSKPRSANLAIRAHLRDNCTILKMPDVAQSPNSDNSF